MSTFYHYVSVPLLVKRRFGSRCQRVHRVGATRFQQLPPDRLRNSAPCPCRPATTMSPSLYRERRASARGSLVWFDSLPQLPRGRLRNSALTDVDLLPLCLRPFIGKTAIRFALPEGAAGWCDSVPATATRPLAELRSMPMSTRYYYVSVPLSERRCHDPCRPFTTMSPSLYLNAFI
jgi:hypothetical protein